MGGKPPMRVTDFLATCREELKLRLNQNNSWIYISGQHMMGEAVMETLDNITADHFDQHHPIAEREVAMHGVLRCVVSTS